MNPKVPHADCANCSLAKHPCVKSTVVEINGPLLIVGEAPGENEVHEGMPFVGKSGRLLRTELKRSGIDVNKCYITNAVLCRPPGNQIKKHLDAIDCCRPRLIDEIRKARPDKVVAMGATALSTLLPEVEDGIMKTRGKHFFSDELDAEIVVTVHPAYLLYMPTQMQSFRRDLSNIYRKMADIPDTRIKLIDSEEDLRQLPAKIVEETYLYDPRNEDGANITCDTETSALKPWDGRLLCVQLSWKEGASAIIVEELLRTKTCKEVLREIFSLPGLTWWGHNLAFDYIWLDSYGFDPPKSWFDTMVLHYTTDENPGSHGLKELGSDLLGVDDWEADIREYVPKKDDSYELIPKPVLHRYAARDTDVNLRLIRPITRMVEDSGWNAYRQVLQPAQRVLAEMESYGMLLDIDRLQQMLSDYRQKQNDMLYYMQQMTWKGFNPNSPKQVGEYLYDELGYKPIKYNKTGPSTDVETLEQLLLRSPDDRFLQLMMEHRAIAKVIGTYLEGLLEAADENGIVHPDFNIIGTVTGRLSAGRYLTLPRVTKNKWAGPIRSLVIARDGRVIVGADYSQAELRVMACEAQEDVWREVWQEGRNIHDEMCFRLFGVHKKDDYEKYMIAKMFTFGLGYGRTPESIALQLKWPVAKARQFYDTYMGAIPKVRAWQSWIKREASSVGYLETAFGRKRRFPIIPPNRRNHMMNEALNFIPQSTASDLTLMSLTQYYDRIVQQGVGHPLLMLHDGIYFEVDEDHAERVSNEVIQLMEEIPTRTYDTYVPFTADVKIGRSWGEAESEEG